MADIYNVSVANGKYTLILPSEGGLHALRYGERWRDLTGDGMVLALVQEIAELREKLTDLVVSCEDTGCVREIEAGCCGDGSYARACRLLGREPKWPEDWDMPGDEEDDDEDSTPCVMCDGDGHHPDDGPGTECPLCEGTGTESPT